MARISGIDIPSNKRLDISLTYVHGIGATRAAQICATLNLDTAMKAGDLTDDQVVAIRDYVDHNFIVEGDLRRVVRQNIQRLIEINCYRGQRHRRNLPVRGQRTRTNARLRRGAKRTVAGRRKATK